MRNRIPALVSGLIFLLACGPDGPPGSSNTELDTAGAAATTGEGGDLDVFVDDPSGAARILFVGRDPAIVPSGWRDAVFIPLSSFSVERDGIPNEFPPADGMAAMLASAGVGEGPVVIVGEPIPAGRAFAGFDYLGLASRAALLDGGPAALGTAPEADGAGGPAGGGVAPRADGDTARGPTAADATGRDAQGDGAQLDIDMRNHMIVDAQWVHEHLDDPRVAILDARPPAEFSGETPGAGIDRPGHIPGAANLFWQELVRSPDDPRLKDEAELRRLFREAGVEPGDIVVSYCRTGGQSSFLYTVARHLGYDVRLYDGSFIDWSRTEYPVER